MTEGEKTLTKEKRRKAQRMRRAFKASLLLNKQNADCQEPPWVNGWLSPERPLSEEAAEGRGGIRNQPFLHPSSRETDLHGYRNIYEVRVRPSSPLRLYPGSVNLWTYGLWREGTYRPMCQCSRDRLTSLIGPWCVWVPSSSSSFFFVRLHFLLMKICWN